MDVKCTVGRKKGDCATTLRNNCTPQVGLISLPVEPLKQVNIGSANLLFEAVRQGISVIVFNKAIARSELAAGGIVELPPPKAERTVYRTLTPKGP